MRHLIKHFDETCWWNIFIRHLRRHCDETFWWDILVRHFDKTLWWGILMRHFEETFLLYNQIRHFDETFWWHFFMAGIGSKYFLNMTSLVKKFLNCTTRLSKFTQRVNWLPWTYFLGVSFLQTGYYARLINPVRVVSSLCIKHFNDISNYLLSSK